MPGITSRQRVTLALDHTEPDRAPFDCTFTQGAYQRLRQVLGLRPDTEARPGGPALNVTPPLEFLEELQVDLYYLGLRRPKNWPVFEYGAESYTDEWGVRYRRIEGGAGWDYAAVEAPLAQARLQDLENYPWPDPDDPALVEGLAEKARDLYENSGFALVGKFNNSLFEQALLLRGMEGFYLDLAQDPEFAVALLDKLLDLALRFIERGLQACGPYLQILRLAGDDMGGQRGTLLSPRMFRSLIKPRFARLYRQAKAGFHRYNPAGKLMAHTDGDVYPLIPDYIEMGLDVLNPVQPYVAEMEHGRLKREFGGRLSFHGGIDLQRVLPFGTPEEVRAEAARELRLLGVGGGYILAPTHYLLPDVPPENVVALRDSVMEYGVYPIQ